MSAGRCPTTAPELQGPSPSREFFTVTLEKVKRLVQYLRQHLHHLGWKHRPCLCDSRDSMLRVVLYRWWRGDTACVRVSTSITLSRIKCCFSRPTAAANVQPTPSAEPESTTSGKLPLRVLLPSIIVPICSVAMIALVSVVTAQFDGSLTKYCRRSYFCGAALSSLRVSASGSRSRRKRSICRCNSFRQLQHFCLNWFVGLRRSRIRIRCREHHDDLTLMY
jgi:hypothetical protein